jgi:hypothetical protein
MLEDHMMQCFGKELCKTIAGRVIVRLQVNTKNMQSVDGTLSSFWDEMCVQVQGGPFFFWESYLEEARELILNEVVKLQEYEKRGLQIVLLEWMGVTGGAGAAPDESVAVDYILDQYLLAEAAKWRDPQIEAFLENVCGSLNPV